MGRAGGERKEGRKDEGGTSQGKAASAATNAGSKGCRLRSEDGWKGKEGTDETSTMAMGRRGGRWKIENTNEKAGKLDGR